jgi:hypothetical protein
MDIPDTTPKILTLGRFSISVQGIPVAINWPDESLKILFCSLLSPLDLFFTWDRISRSLLSEPATRTTRRRLEKCCVRPLKSFLIKELGCNPLISGPEGIRIDRQAIHIDAFEFFSAYIEGIRLLSFENAAAARATFSRADSLYAGTYLPGIAGKIIDHTRIDLESLYRSAVMNGFRHTHIAQPAF